MKKTITLLLFIITLTITAQEVKFGKVSAAEINEQFHPLDSTANAAYLYKYRKTYYDYNQTEGFIVITEIHERIKIYNKEGLDYANRSISYYKPESGGKEKVSSIKGYTFNIKDGKIIKEKLSKNQIFDEKKSKFYSQKKIAMPAATVGSVIDLKYEIRSPFIYNIEDVKFQYAIPVKKYFTKIQIPEYFVFRKNSKGYYHIPLKKSFSDKSIKFTSSNRRQYATTSFQSSTTNYKTIDNSFTTNNVPALNNNEPFVGSIKNYRGGISYELSSVQYPNSSIEYFNTTWEDVSKTIYKSSNFGGELSKTSYFKKDLPVLLENTSNDYEKLGAVFQHVKSKVKWNKYYSMYTDQGVRKAYKEGVGNVADINLMLTAMLREAGLNANPVLVSSINNGTPLFPTKKGFDYVISIVEFPDNSYVLLDATERYSTPNVLPFRVLNWNGRKVTKDGNSSWVTLTPKKHALLDQKLYTKITPENTIEGLQKTTFKNFYALNYRSENNKLKEEVVITNLEEKHGIEIDEFKVINDKTLGKPVSRTIKFTRDDLIEEINGKLYINPLLYLATTENPFKSEERKFPVNFVTPWLDKNFVYITIPEGYKVEFLPETLAIGLPDNLGVFKFIVKQSGNKISAQSIMQFNNALIAPQYYSTLKKFYADLVAKQAEKIILVKE